MTLGEKRVRTDFNVTSSDAVTLIKQKTAELIDLCQKLKDFNIDMATTDKPIDYELHRLVALAQTAYEEAGMWAVKAATCK